MGLRSGILEAEGVRVTTILPSDLIVIQRFNYDVPSQYSPLNTTMGTILGGSVTLGVGTVTLAAGTATVALPAITAASKIFLNEANATPNALGYVITPGTGFVIHSASGADTSSVSYFVLS
jgi:hypothetical protein